MRSRRTSTAPSLVGSGGMRSWWSMTHSTDPASVISGAGSNQTILPSASIVAPQATAHRATMTARARR